MQHMEMTNVLRQIDFIWSDRMKTDRLEFPGHAGRLVSDIHADTDWGNVINTNLYVHMHMIPHIYTHRQT